VNGVKTRPLADSGAQPNAIGNDWAVQHHVPILPLTHKVHVNAVDGSGLEVVGRKPVNTINNVTWTDADSDEED